MFLEYQNLKEERKEAELSTALYSIGESDERIDFRRLLKRARMKKMGRHHNGANALITAVATSVPVSLKSKGSTSLLQEKPVVIGSEKEQGAGVAEPEEPAANIPKTEAVPERKLQVKPKPFTVSSLKPGDIWKQLMQ